MSVLSASQIGTFGTIPEGGNNEGCNRKWAFKYLAKLPDPSGSSAEAGKKIHAYLEHWLRDSVLPGNVDREAHIASAMLKHLPPPPQRRVEEPFTFELEGVAWRGYKDLVYQDGPALVIHDHKSTSNLRWMKTEEDLRHDAQSILYAYHAFMEADVVDLQWLYGTREKYPKVQKVRLNLTFEDVAKAMPPLTRTARRVLSYYTSKPDPNSLEPNLALCDAYGGCPFKSVCKISPVQRVKALQLQLKQEQEKQMGFRDRIKTAPEVPVAQAPVGDTPVQADVVAILNAAPVPARATMREKLGFGSAINPPPMESRDADAPAAALLEDMAGQTRAAFAGAAEQVPTKRKPGRPKKVDAVVAATKEWDDSVRAALVTPIRDVGIEFDLYINCIPSGPWLPLSKYLEPVLADIRQEHGVDHYAQIDYKAAGILGAKLYTALQSSPPRGALVVDRNTREGQDCLGTLERFAVTVTRGF